MSEDVPKQPPQIQKIVADAIRVAPGITVDDLAAHLRAVRGEGTVAQVTYAINEIQRDLDLSDLNYPVRWKGRVWRTEDFTNWRRKNKSEKYLWEIVKEGIERNPGISAADLADYIAEYKGRGTVRQVRNTVMSLRRVHGSDSPDHPVAYQGGYWRAGDLMRKGVTLYVTDAGVLCPIPDRLEELRTRIKDPAEMQKHSGPVTRWSGPAAERPTTPRRRRRAAEPPPDQAPASAPAPAALEKPSPMELALLAAVGDMPDAPKRRRRRRKPKPTDDDE